MKKMHHERLWLGAGAVALTAGAALLFATISGAGARVAHASPVPSRISASSSAIDVMRFAEASGTRWRTLSIEGRTRSGGSERPFRVWVDRDKRARSEDGDEVRIRNGAARVRADRRTGSVRRFAVPALAPSQQSAMQARMARHRADDPTLAREGEQLVDTPVNDLVSPARIVRKELGLAATSVRVAGTATVAGREAVVLEARFPAELAKEDHWDVYVDVQTGVLLGLVIEPREGEDLYECFVESLAVDPALPDALFDAADPVPAP